METEAKTRGKATGRYPPPTPPPKPTRLQTHAPPCLQLDLITAMASSSAEPFPRSEIDSRKAIPLLSPLDLSPKIDLHNDEDRIIGGHTSTTTDDDDEVAANDAVSPENGWQHPAVPATFADPSSLFGFFQSQCIIANQAQT